MTSYGLSKGLTLSQASLLVSAGMIGNTVSKLINGILSDRIGVFPTNMIMFGISATATVALLYTSGLFPLLLLAFFYGFVYSISGLGYSLIDKEYYGPEQYKSVQPIVVFASTAFYAFGNPLIGAVFDYTGDFRYPFFISATCSLFGLFCLVYLQRKSNEDKRVYEEN
ncbi:MAG: MFS transporter [Oscillospiraceae bacterium]|nr:MFS transporter [Oscillospiraceae bacterium]